jgi:hypothetical protein
MTVVSMCHISLARMEATRGQSQEPQECAQRHKLAGAIHRSQDPDFGASVGQTLVRQRESRASKQGEGEPKECREFPHASPELQDLLLEFGCPQVRYVQARADLPSKFLSADRVGEIERGSYFGERQPAVTAAVRASLPATSRLRWTWMTSVQSDDEKSRQHDRVAGADIRSHQQYSTRCRQASPCR